MKRLTYKDAGVDIDAEEEGIFALKRMLGFRRKGIGAAIEGEFTGLIDFGDFALTLCTDGVGTKLLIADAMEKWDTVGIDCIAMNVNDTICQGAEPIAFVDYLAVEEPDPILMRELGKGLNRGAELANISIVGGETATLGEIVKGFDIAGAALGYVKKENIIDGEDVVPGDKIIGLPSSGIHSNGLTLARKIIEEGDYDYHDQCEYGIIGELLLEPTEIYVKTVMDLIKDVHIKGMANITGGGLRNLKRINSSCGYNIIDPLPTNPVFEFLQSEGDVTDKEMYQTFNMGMGLALVVSKEHAEKLAVKTRGKVVGEVIEGTDVLLDGKDIRY
ncbi:MAG: phosphoribosylformylglycinamidine cyclo-ligase [Thermoplasmata archaeon]